MKYWELLFVRVGKFITQAFVALSAVISDFSFAEDGCIEKERGLSRQLICWSEIETE